jgi:GH15 family glucan-1,4-alpha-glucosidase
VTVPIGDYAIVGDCRSAALVSRGGSIDWLCWPRFDSPSIFGAILDDRAGRWLVAPAGPFRSSRSYVEGTNVLRTRFETDSGALVLTDLMPVASDADKRRFLFPDHELVRLVECERGEVELESVFEPRPGYGRRPARPRRAGALGVRVTLEGGGLLVLRSDVDLEIQDGVVRGRARLRAGDALRFSLTFEHDEAATIPPLGDWTREAVRRSIAWWSEWIATIDYDGPARAAVERSALLLRLMVYAPSGAILAAPTTSLPERLGGDLNWDYRYCWLRDASLTMRALAGLGLRDEAQAFVSWLLHSTRLTRPELRIFYDVHGNPPLGERTLDHLAGYGGARPVRIGNGASRQLQLDVYGEVIDAVFHLVCGGRRLDRETAGMLRDFGDYVMRRWREPDEGIWEPRSGRRPRTHSRALCWTALDRLVELGEKEHVRGLPLAALRAEREAIRREIETRAWNPQLQSYVATLDGDGLDASLLLLSWYGFHPASSDRMRSTYARIRERLGAGDGLLHRYEDGESPGEGAFGVCSFWGVEHLALGGGTPAEAEAALESLLRRANDVGLYGEEIDPATGAALGNFPQAFTHVGLINAALSIQRARRGQRVVERTAPHAREVARS